MKQSILKIDDNEIKIKEITPKTAKVVLANFYEALSDPELNVMKFMDEKYDQIVDLTKDFIVMPHGVALDELAFSDIDLIIEEFKVVNKSFLAKLVSMGVISQQEADQVPESEPLPDSENLKEPSTTQ